MAFAFDPEHPDLRALFPPVEGYPYFQGGPGFEPSATDYSPANAWLLAEISLLAYAPLDEVRSLIEAQDDSSPLLRPGGTDGVSRPADRPYSRRGRSMHPSFHLTRRQFVALSGLAAADLARPGNGSTGPARGADAPSKSPVALAPDAVLRKLLDGNRRFLKGETTNPRRKPEDFAPLAEGQNPVAVIVGCADSRVSPELLFDQGVGDLFVVRVAGNVISGTGAAVKGSIEYAVAELGVSLVLVLGHTQCGAVKAALRHIAARDTLPGAIEELVNTIKPAVARAKGQAGDALENAIKANVGIGVERLKSLEPILASPVKQGKVKVVGAVYNLHTGGVTVLA